MVGVGVAAVVPWLRWWWGLLPLAGAPLAALHGLLRFRDTGWAIDPGERLIARNGGLNRVTTIVPRRRLQRRSLVQGILQRRASLATFEAAVASGGAGGRVHLEHLDVAAASDLLDRLGPAATASSPTPSPPTWLAAASPELAGGGSA